MHMHDSLHGRTGCAGAAGRCPAGLSGTSSAFLLPSISLVHCTLTTVHRLPYLGSVLRFRPRPYKGITFSLDTPALHTGHSLWPCCIHCTHKELGLEARVVCTQQRVTYSIKAWPAVTASTQRTQVSTQHSLTMLQARRTHQNKWPHCVIVGSAASHNKKGPLVKRLQCPSMSVLT